MIPQQMIARGVDKEAEHRFRRRAMMSSSPVPLSSRNPRKTAATFRERIGKNPDMLIPSELLTCENSFDRGAGSSDFSAKCSDSKSDLSSEESAHEPSARSNGGTDD